MTTTDARPDIRRGDDRGTTDLGWLHSRHSFSFGRHHDPDRMGFRALRVLNDDRVAPGGGFAEHGHADMEILSWVLDGALAHADSTGTRGVLRPGELQVMSAGRGIRHSEMNASDAEPVHFLQIWIEPARAGAAPRYDQRAFRAANRRGRWQRLADPAGRDGALPIGQDAAVLVADLAPGETLEARAAADRHGYLHVATGAVRVGAGDRETLRAGDAVAVVGPATLELQGAEDAQLLWFDLA